MANCAYRIFKDGTNYGIVINVTDSTTSTWGNFSGPINTSTNETYALYVNGNAAFVNNPRIFGTQYPGFMFLSKKTNRQRVGEQFMVTTAVGDYYRPSYQAFRTYSYNSTTGVVDTSNYETFNLPTVNADRTNSSAWKIMTEKEYSLPTTWRAATSDTSGVVSTGAQTFAGSKTFNSWIAASGNVYVRENNSSIAGGMNCLYAGTTSTWDHRITFYQYSYNVDGTRTDKYDRFYFPVTASASDANSTYLIITTKNPSSLTITDLSGTLTVAKGGTGATTAANARTQLGLGTIATKATTDYKTVQSTVSGGTENGIRFLATISQNANGVISVTDTLVRDASTTQSGLVGTSDQTFAGQKTFTSSIDIQTAWGYLRWKKSIGNKDISALIAANNATTTDPARFAFYHYILNSSGNHITNDVYERFLLPAVTTTRTASVDYNILTTKNLVTVAQGGTGASIAEKGTVTYATNDFTNGTGGLKVYRVGKMGVFIATGQTVNNHGESGYVKVATINEGWRPKEDVTQRVPLLNYNWILRITTGGEVQFSKSTSDATTFYTTMVFPIAD